MTWCTKSFLSNNFRVLINEKQKVAKQKNAECLWICLEFTTLRLFIPQLLIPHFYHLGSFLIFNSKFFKNHIAKYIRTCVLGIAAKFCFWYWASFSALINSHFLWNHQNCCGFLIISEEIQGVYIQSYILRNT